MKALREEKGMSQAELGVLLNCSKQTISNYESGRRRPAYETLEAACDVFNVPRAYFFTEEEKRQQLQYLYAHNESLPNQSRSLATSFPDISTSRGSGFSSNCSANNITDGTEYSRENYNGLNVEEAKQFAQGVSNEAMRIALLYDSLDDHGQEILNAIASIEFSRIELANAAQGIAELDRIGAKRLGSFAGLPHYEMGNPSVSSAKYFARAERAELEKEETETKAAYAEERE